ncbi:unnamed protein product [Brachionus calyciflorus]|uniref:Tetratricopeptide repeat protein n=1 Tax=Brachionus calyciflorus TaxID=104777 RepID=A0A813Z0B7_9BILA|nr:unnamed protein product [Brachionus calyciflorus]
MEFLDNRQKINYIKEKISTNDYDYSCLNLERIFLEEDDIKEIENLLIKNEYVRNVKWNSKNKNIYSIEKLIARNLIRFRRYASDYVHALLSKHVYYITQFKRNEQVSFNNIKGIDSIECENRNRILKDWSIEEIYSDASLDSYGGALYINKRRRQVVLASKGTDEFLGVLFEENSVVNTDIEAVFLGNFIKPVSHAFILAEKNYNKWVIKEKYNLSFTGHSLGGWFASMQCFHFQFEKKVNNVQAVAFESPGVKMNVEDFSTNLELLNSNFAKKNLNIITYLSVPNFVNTCNSHCGKKCYVLTLNGRDSGTVINVKNPGFTDFFIACGFLTAEHHKLDKMLQYFDSRTGEFKNPDNIREVIDWPCLKKNIPNHVLVQATTYGNISSTMKRGIFNLTANLVKISTKILPEVRPSFKELNTVFTVIDEKLKVFYEGHLKTKPLDHSNDFLSRNQIDDILFDSFYSKLEPYDFMSKFLKLLVDTYTVSESSNERKISLKANREPQFSGKYFKSIDDLKEIVFNMVDLEDIRTKLNMSEKCLLDKTLYVFSDLKLNDCFIERPAIIDQLNKESAKSDIVIVYGTPCIGKTELIRYYALSQENSFFILDATSIETFYSDLKKISNTLEVDYDERQVNDWYDKIFNKLRRYKAIFIIENLSDKELSINQFLVLILRNNWCRNFKIFLTKRTKKIKESLILNQGEIVNFLKVNGLKFSEIKNFFVVKDLFKRGFTNEQLKEIIKELGDGLLISPFNTLKLLNFILKDYPNKTSQEILIDIKDHAIHFINKELYESIYNSLDYNFRIEFLKLISILDNEFISIDYLKDFLRLNESMIIMSQLDLLAEVGLIEISNDRSGIRVDSLFRSDMKIFIKQKELETFKDETKYLNENNNFNNRLVSYLITAYRSECLFFIFSNWIYKNDYFEKNTYFIRHLNAIVKSQIDIPDKMNNFLFCELFSFSKIAVYDFKAALNSYKDAVEILEKIYKEQNLILANALYNLAILFDYNGNYEMSLLYHETCLKMRRDLLDNNDHVDIVFSLVGLGCINHKLGFLSNAHEFKKEAFEMANRLHTQPSYLTAYTQIELSLVNIESGRLHDFESLTENSIIDQINIFSAELDLDFLNLWAGDAYLAKQDFEEALNCYNKCINTKSKIIKSTLMYKKAIFNFYVGKYDEALTACDESIKIQSQVYQNKHPVLALTFRLKAKILIKNLEKHDKIKICLAKALKIEQFFFQEKSPNSVKISVYSALADFYDYTKKFNKALSYRTKAYIFTNLLDKNNKLDIAKALNDLSLTLFNLGNIQDAEKYVKRSLETVEEIKDFSFRKNFLKAEIVHNYGIIMGVIREKKYGLSYIKDALELRKTIFKDNNQPDISNSLQIFGHESIDLGNSEEGLEYIMQSNSITSQLYNKNNRHYIQSLISLGIAYRKLNKLQEMLNVLKEARSYAVNFSDQNYIDEIDQIILDAYNPLQN